MKKIICFDLDNVICKTKKSLYKTSKPILKNINFINSLYDKGYKIKIFTARYMGRNNDNIIKANKQGLKLTKSQLKKWGLKYHQLKMGKPSYDVFIDDKNLEFKSNWINSLKKKLKLK